MKGNALYLIKWGGGSERPYFDRVHFRESGGRRRILSIDLDNGSVSAVQAKFDGEQVAGQPSVHELICQAANRLGGKVASVFLKDINRGVYAADIYVEVGGREVIIDCGGGDAVLLAVLCGIPLFCAEKILAEEGYVVNDEGKMVLPIVDDDDPRAQEFGHSPFGEFIASMSNF